MPDLHLHRQQFPHIQDYAYFNYGGQGLMPSTSLNAIQTAQLQSQRMAPFSNQGGLSMVQATQQLKQTLAENLHISPTHLALTDNTTTGCNIALWGLDWRPGDRLLLTDCEHQGIIAIAQELAQRFGIIIDRAPLVASPESPTAIIAALITPHTRLLVLSHILWNTGLVLPLEAIVAQCHAKGVQVLVDGAQSVGVLPLDLDALDADYYAFTGHKWWCGPPGLGGLHIKDTETLRPTFLGWRSVQLDSQGQPQNLQPDARRYEVSTSAFTLYPGLQAALQVHAEYGDAHVRYQDILNRSALLWNALAKLPGIKLLTPKPPASGLVAFQLDRGHHQQAVTHLENRKIYVRQILYPDCLRASLHYFTSETEIQRLIDGITEIVALPIRA
jgi:L-cysteine/cystine lyase